MSQDEFNKQIEETLRKLARLKAVRDGKLEYRRILVRAYSVQSYTVRSHYRQIAQRKLTAVKTARAA